MGGEEKRHQMMQNLFGDQSEEEEDEVDSEHESNPQMNYASDEAEGELRRDRDGDMEVDGEGNGDVESDGETREAEADPGESEGEREASSGESDNDEPREQIEVNRQRRDAINSDSERDETSSADLDDGEQREVSDHNEHYSHRKPRKEVIISASEKSEDEGDEEDDEEDNHEAETSSYPKRKQNSHVPDSVPEIRDVFGDSEDEDEYASPNIPKHKSHHSPDEDRDHFDEDDAIESSAHKEKPLGPPLEIEIPFRSPPAESSKMNLIKVSNIMGIDDKEFDPKTYVEEKTFVTDESGAKKRLRLENNIVRWRTVRKKDGTSTIESNARFVKWSDGSLQLQIGNEVLDISVQDAQHEQTHLFLQHNKSLLQSQGRVMQKMRFMPSSLTSNSHRLLTALVDSRHRKVYKVKNCVTDIDPEKEKEEKEKAESQNIRASVLLNRKKEKVNRKYNQTVDRRRQLSPGYLEGALDEDDEQDYYDPKYSRRRYEEDMEAEARAEKRIMNAKKGHKDIGRKPLISNARGSKAAMNYSESDREESEYESDGEEDAASPSRKVEEADEYEEEDDDDNYKELPSEEDEEEPKQKSGRKRTGIESDEDSPPRKVPAHRRMAVVYDSDDE